MSSRWLQILFFVFGGLELAAEFLNYSNLRWVAKPMLLILLIGFYLQKTSSLNKVFLAALVFCWLGDNLLLFNFFIGGLAAFLVTHLLLIISYRQSRFASVAFEGTQKVRLAFPIVLAASGLVVVLYPGLGELKIPVMVYALVLALMVLQSIFRLGRTSTKSFWMVFSGAIFFMFSDSVLAINKFYQPMVNAGVWIMVTYITAVYLIVHGVIAHSESDISKRKR